MMEISLSKRAIPEGANKTATSRINPLDPAVLPKKFPLKKLPQVRPSISSTNWVAARMRLTRMHRPVVYRIWRVSRAPVFPCP